MFGFSAVVSFAGMVNMSDVVNKIEIHQIVILRNLYRVTIYIIIISMMK